MLGRVAAALRPGGVFLLSVRVGDGEQWEVGDSGNPCFTVLWREPDLCDLLEDAGLDLVWRAEAEDSEEAIEVGGSGRNVSRGKKPEQGDRVRSSGVLVDRDVAGMPRAELADLIQQLTDQMMQAARDLQFELAARLRDEIAELKKELRGMDAAGVK